MTESGPVDSQIFAIERPQPNLLLYYVIAALAWGPAAPVGWVLKYLRYRTLRYRFSEEGVSMSWGAMFRREIHLTYSRIQDIHLTSNVIERWLGLAKVAIQTASGKSKAEMTIEGVAEYEAVRDFLYDRMRGARSGTDSQSADGHAGQAGTGEELVQVFQEMAEELARLRTMLENRQQMSSKSDG